MSAAKLISVKLCHSSSDTKGRWRSEQHTKSNSGSMGQEVSSPVDESTPSRTLEARSIDAIATYVKTGRARNIVVMVGLTSSHLNHVPQY